MGKRRGMKQIVLVTALSLGLTLLILLVVFGVTYIATRPKDEPDETTPSSYDFAGETQDWSEPASLQESEEKEPESEPEESLTYAQEKGLLLQEPEKGQTYSLDGLVYALVNPEGTCRQAPCDILIEELDKEEREGGFAWHIKLVLTMEGTTAQDGLILGECVTPSVSLGDKYTGMVFPERTMFAVDVNEETVTLSDVQIQYRCCLDTEAGDWVAEESGVMKKAFSFRVMYDVEANAQYDGLVMRIVPVSRMPDDMEESVQWEEQSLLDGVTDEEGLFFGL